MSEEKPITDADLHAFVDNKTAGERCAQIDAWLAEHPEAAERVADYRRMNEALREAYDPALAEPIPERLTLAATRRPAAGSGVVAGPPPAAAGKSAISTGASHFR